MDKFNGFTNLHFSCVSSKNGWTSDEICEAWFDKVFIKTALERRVSDAPIVLLLDGHGSHITPRVRKLAYENKIFLFCLPPKTNHKAQPLDVAIFNLVQAAWKPACGEAAQNGEVASKASTITKYMSAREAGLHEQGIKDAWRRSAHHPFNPDIFTDEDYAPSIVSSIKTHLPQSFPIFPVPASSSDTASLLSGVASPEELLLQAIHESLEVPSNSQHQSTPTQALQSRLKIQTQPV